MSATIPTQIPLSAEVMEYVRAHQVEHCLQPLLEMTQKMFPTAQEFSVYFEQDPELRDVQSIVFDVCVPRRDVPDFVQVYHQWVDQSFQICTNPLAHHFVLRLITAE